MLRLAGEVVCMNKSLSEWRGGAKSVVRGGGLLLGTWPPASYREEPFVAKTAASPAWPFTAEAPVPSRAATADDKAPAANYPGDGEPLKWDCQSRGWPFCLEALC